MLAGLGVGFSAWSQRRRLGRALLAVAAVCLGGPLLLALAVAAALGGLDAGAVAGGAGAAGAVAAGGTTTARPMVTFVVTQRYGCTGFGLEPPRGACPHFHFGIDLAAPAGTPVSSVAAGQAEVFEPGGPGGGYGLHVVVRHAAGVETMYAHLANTVIAQGQRVLAGTVLGHEGSSGLSTGPHLHFEVREAGVAVDPSSVFPGAVSPEGQPR